MNIEFMKRTSLQKLNITISREFVNKLEKQLEKMYGKSTDLKTEYSEMKACFLVKNKKRMQ